MPCITARSAYTLGDALPLKFQRNDFIFIIPNEGFSSLPKLRNSIRAVGTARFVRFVDSGLKIAHSCRKANFNQVFRQAKRCKTTDLITDLFRCPVAAVLLQVEAKLQASILQGEIAQDIKPLKYQFKLGDRCSRDGALSWTNLTREKIREIKGDKAWLDHWCPPIPISQLILIVEEVEA